MAFLGLLLLLAFGFTFGGVASGGGSTKPQPLQLELRMRDSGRSISMQRGQEAVLRLPDRWTWADPTVTGGIEVGTISSFRDTGFTEWSLLPTKRGTATVATHGEPGGKRFRITIRVR
jgi:hypothetical protein